MKNLVAILVLVLLPGCTTTPIFSEFRVPSENSVHAQIPSPGQMSELRERFTKLCTDYRLTLNLPERANPSWLHYYRDYESRFFKDDSKEKYLVAIFTIKDGKAEVFVSSWTPDAGENQKFIQELTDIFISVFGESGYSMKRRQEYVIFS
ncbi:MAG: hypothetical protein Q8M02_03500 [Candidatus Didemnitutus sp.]|nr:hypothetical protein [Candidatus Didemnitutus sp.]